MNDPAASRLFRFDRPAGDSLGVLSSTAGVAEENPWVRIDPDAVARFAQAHREATPPKIEDPQLHCTFLEPRRFCNYLLALEALNFCFWDRPPRWRVLHRGDHDGYWALAAALHRTVTEDGVPLWNADFLAALEMPALEHILRGEGRPPPLMEARLAHLREAGRVLREGWGGEFARLIEDCAGSAVALVEKIVEQFPSFRDEVVWQGEPVRIYKRAQICVADLARLLPGEPLGKLTGLERLTAFADYKVPQVMRGAGILVFHPDLARRIDGGEEIPAGAGEEIAIRATTIWGCEWIARAMSRMRGAPVAPSDVDYLLWCAGQNDPALPPYHRTRTVYY